MIGVIVGVVISSVLYAKTGFSLFGAAPNQHAPAAETSNAELTSLAYTVIRYINESDYPALSHVAHPEFGVVFSPHATVSLTTNKCFQAGQIAAFASDTKVYVWGVHESTGEPIEMNPESYFAEYISNRDYMSASIVGVNRIVKSGNALENIKSLFPDVQFIDFHIPGSDKDAAEDFEWSSLRLGFEEYEGRLWLTVILSSKWTV